MKIVVGVGIASYPIAAAGNTWNSLNWVLSFRELGWDVWIVEAISADKCVDASWRPALPEQSANLTYWRTITEQFGLTDRSSLFIDDKTQNLDVLRDFSAEADIFLNLSGHFKSRAVSFPKAIKIYQDGDPGFSQVWAESHGVDMNFAGHDRFITAGLRLGQPGAAAPTCGIEWLPTFPPVVLKYWPYTPHAEFDRFTSIAHWGGYERSEWRGHPFDGKRQELVKIVDAPKFVFEPIELATQVSAHEYELGPFRQAGWNFVEAGAVCSTLEAYGEYIRSSSAEFSIAKGGYVQSRTGWFSDRSVCYAASGRPLVIQDTGIGDLLPLGAGVHTFSTPQEAAALCNQVIADFAYQQQAARKLAEEKFDSEKVIPSLLNRL